MKFWEEGRGGWLRAKRRVMETSDATKREQIRERYEFMRFQTLTSLAGLLLRKDGYFVED